VSRRVAPLITGNIYHVYNRGVHKVDIFTSESDYLKWELMLYWYANYDYPLSYYARRAAYARDDDRQLKKLETDMENKYAFEKPIVSILAYVEMPNHFHLILEQNIDNGISKFMHKMSTAYTQHYNQKYEMTGSLFQGYFKSSLINNDLRLHQLLHYVLRNPLEAGLVTDKSPLYIWSSAPEYLGRKNKEHEIVSSRRLPSFVYDATKLNEFIKGEPLDGG